MAAEEELLEIILPLDQEVLGLLEQVPLGRHLLHLRLVVLLLQDRQIVIIVWVLTRPRLLEDTIDQGPLALQDALMLGAAAAATPVIVAVVPTPGREYCACKNSRY